MFYSRLKTSLQAIARRTRCTIIHTAKCQSVANVLHFHHLSSDYMGRSGGQTS